MKKHPKQNPIKSMNILLIAIALACFGLAPMAEAVVPAPDGGYPGGNTAEGQSALLSLTTGTYNTAVGAGTLLLNTGKENTATGAGALLNNTIGIQNSAHGAFALFSNTEGSFNTATGDQALFSNTGGEQNTATGFQALVFNTTGDFNTAVGMFSLRNNITGNSNTATGASALGTNTTGVGNTATGTTSLASNTTGNNNTANGFSALYSNTTGGSNAAVGDLALYNNTTGTANVAFGNAAGFDQTTGNNNVYIGVNVPGVADESNTIRIGDNLPQGGQSNCYIGGIFDGAIDPDSFLVGVDVNNKLGDHTTAGPRLRIKDVVENLKKVEELEATVAALTTQIQKVSTQLETSKPKITRKDKKMKIDKTDLKTKAIKPMNTKLSILIIPVVLACFGLLPGAQGVSPAPDGGYPGGNTAEGQNALLSRTTGTYNTAVGVFSVLSLTDGNFCTGVGAGTLLANTAEQNTATGAGALLSNTTGA